MTQKDLNMSESIWMEYMKDCYSIISYHPGKANIVPDALSREKMMTTTTMKIWEFNMLKCFSRWNPMLNEENMMMCAFFVKPKLKNKIVTT